MKQSLISGVIVLGMVSSYVAVSGMLNGAPLSAVWFPIFIIALPFAIAALATSVLAHVFSPFFPRLVAITLSGIFCGIALGAFMFFGNPMSSPPEDLTNGFVQFTGFGLLFAGIALLVEKAWPSNPLQPIA
jgi:CHASE2 domain-containing sensor protein